MLSIVAVATVLLDLGLGVATPRLARRARRSSVFVYAAAFAAVALLVDASFSTIVCFYVPTLVLFLIVAAWQAARTRGAGWTQIPAALGISVLAARLPQARVSIRPEHFDHNAVYHVLQAVALLLV